MSYLPADETAIAALPCWQGTIEIAKLAGGLSNRNYRVADRSGRYVVRLAGDVPEHGLLRRNEVAASRAAHLAGIAPELVYDAPGVLVLRQVDGVILTPEEVRRPAMVERVAALLRRVHGEVGRQLRGPAIAFWVFHAIRDYAARLGAAGGETAAIVARYRAIGDALETALGPVAITFAHNDMMAANLIDDGKRLWLIDWEYGGFDTPLFDLANLATNNDFDAALADLLLEAYHGSRPNEPLRRAFATLRCASLLRETMWSMVCERFSPVAFDFAAYTRRNAAAFDTTYAEWREG
jgi:thiamine kinase-like enzyme